MPSNCCICKRRDVVLHRFPIYEVEQFQIWVERAAQEKFSNMTEKQIYRCCVICDRHFADECKIPGSKRLKLYSLPTLDMPGNPNYVNPKNFCSTYLLPPALQNNDAVLNNSKNAVENTSQSIKVTSISTRENNDLTDKSQLKEDNTKKTGEFVSNFVTNEDYILDSNDNVDNLDINEVVEPAEDIHYISSDDETIILTNLDHNLEHNYSDKVIKKKKAPEEYPREKSKFLDCQQINLDSNKIALTDYVNEKTVCDLNKLELKQSAEGVDDRKCCICYEVNINLICFYQMDDSETYFNKMKFAFPDMQLNFNDISNEICENCAENLRISFKFRKTIIEGQKKIAELKPKPKNPIFLKDLLPRQKNYITPDLPRKSEDKCDSNNAVKDILSKLDGIIITKTKNTSEIDNQKVKTTPYIYRCNFCSIQFNNLMSLYHHKIFSHGQDQYRHQILNKMKSQKHPSILENTDNIENVSPNKKRRRRKERQIFSCEICSKILRSQVLFDEHKNRHKGIKNFYCEKCGKGFFSMRQLTSHFESHNESKDFKCDICDKTFKGQRTLNTHKQVYHRQEQYICHVCGTIKKNVLTFKMHMVCHSNERKFSCTICSNRFKRKSDLRNHLRTHTNERPYKCTKCDESYRSSYSLKLHLVKYHLKVRNFKCDICNKQFYSKKNLAQHSFRHKSNPFASTQCDICKKRFVDVYSLKAHMSIHSEKLRCTKCLKSFKLASSLNKHMERNHSDTQVYDCNNCKGNFDSVEDLQTHDCVILLQNKSTNFCDDI